MLFIYLFICIFIDLFIYSFIYFAFHLLIRGHFGPEDSPFDRHFYPEPLDTTQSWVISYKLDGKFLVWFVSPLITLSFSMLVEQDSLYNRIIIGYSTQLIFLIIRLVPGNVIMVASDMRGKSPTTGELIHGITGKRYCPITFCFVIVILTFATIFIVTPVIFVINITITFLFCGYYC